MKKLLFFALAIIFGINASAQFHSVQALSGLTVTTDTQDKPQSKIWTYAGKHWSVLTNQNGTFLYRLDPGNIWTNVLQLSTNTYARADCKAVGNVTHIFLFRDSVSQLVSVEFDQAADSYIPWSVRPSKVTVNLDNNVETATIDVDSRGRMWVASDASVSMKVRWADSPYTNWSAPITLVTGTDMDDISGIIALPASNQIGVFWSNQKAKRFGFKTHTDGTDPAIWSVDEVPASQSAANVGLGMADDHLNLAVASNGTLFAAVKTSFDSPSYPKLGLLVRRPNGVWDDLYAVSQTGTRPIVILNEQANRLKVVYTASELGGDIVYKESPLSNIGFSQPYTAISGNYNYVTSTKDNFSSDVVLMASTNTQAVSILGTDRQSLSTGPQYLPQLRDLKVFPNPFTQQTNINFSIPKGGEYKLALYDINGSLKLVLNEDKAIPGKRNNIPLDGSHLSSGIYFLKLETNEEVSTLKLIVTR